MVRGSGKRVVATGSKRHARRAWLDQPDHGVYSLCSCEYRLGGPPWSPIVVVAQERAKSIVKGPRRSVYATHGPKTPTHSVRHH